MKNPEIKITERIHLRAKEVAKDFKRNEVELIEVLEQVDLHSVYYAYKYSSMFAYVVGELNFSEEVAISYITVARKSRQIPALKEFIKSGRITVSKAKKLCPIITPKNKDHWLELAATVSKSELERLTAEASPRAAHPDKTKFLSSKVVQLQVAVSYETMQALRRAQDVLSQKLRRPATLGETIEFLVDEFLKRHDPLRKASRQEIRGKLLGIEQHLPVPGPVNVDTVSKNSKSLADSESALGSQQSEDPTSLFPDEASERTPIPASTKHKVILKFDGQCAYIDDRGTRCERRRFLEIHHIKPVSEGGGNELENLELLCSGHHKVRHLN